ncbi:SDR family NAD(P)-dependent oxidoreductase [Silvibacterium acidisoli]|uniref:SDR family NAD(P)-dependent oxidoreductase n=1 Tax=Acidobacteriaceae bacterium ZG23-2 TaxID=2883246 RepID=UPI00406C9E58
MTLSNQYARYPSLCDRTVLVTGGASGIGASMVEEFARQGSRVAFLDLAAEPAEELVRGLSGHASHAPLFLQCDMTDIDALRRAIVDVENRLGAIQVLVNNAANDDRHDFKEVTPEYWDNRMNVNLRHHFFTMQAVSAGMAAAGGGSIINMSSISWIIPSTGLPAYVTAKAAIVGMTRAMAHELGPGNIRVNSVLPGAILTERQRRLWWTPQYEAEIMGRQALKRNLTPEDVARTVLFLASDDSSAITNQSFIVDGGWV